MKVLSLFDGISCGRLALDRLGVKVDKYVAYEIDVSAVEISKSNYPDIQHYGDVTTCNGNDYGDFDLLLGGSPCQNLSAAMANREGLDGQKSKLFFEYLRIYEEMKPKYFLFENVGGMPKEDRDIITGLFGVEPVKINSSVVSPALRNRLYWTNVSQRFYTGRDIKLQDILEYGYTDRIKARALLASDSRPLSTPLKMVHRYFNTGFTTLIFKNEEHYNQIKEHFIENFKGMSANDIDYIVEAEGIDVSLYDGVRYMTQNELEACMTLPKDYTKVATRNRAAHHIGNCWTIDVIVDLLRGVTNDSTR